MAANEVSIYGNGGIMTGLAGTAVVYIGQVNSKYGFFYKLLNTTPDPDVEQWTFLSRDAFLVAVASGNGSYHSGIDVSSMLNEGNSATFITPVAGNDWKVNVINDNSLPRLYNNQPFYSLRGSGIAVIDPNTATYSNAPAVGPTAVAAAAAKSGSAEWLETIFGAKAAAFIKDNSTWIFVALLVVAYLLYMEKTGKGKKKAKFLGLF